MLARVNEVTEIYIRPQLKKHGGDIEILDINDNIVRIRLTGSCSGCPAASLTVESIVKAELVSRIPGIKDVEIVSCVDQELIDFAKNLLKKDK